ncbi:MAG: hypothetical protein WC238_05815 [Parcubacteria group bacterium]|jgi:antitoxin component of MazEF toxin-antitoxin module
MKIITKPKLWGNSLGFIIPSEIVKKEGITLDTNITIEIRKENPLREVFGSLKNWNINSQEIKDELRKEEEKSEERKWKK